MVPSLLVTRAVDFTNSLLTGSIPAIGFLFLPTKSFDGGAQEPPRPHPRLSKFTFRFTPRTFRPHLANKYWQLPASGSYRKKVYLAVSASRSKACTISILFLVGITIPVWPDVFIFYPEKEIIRWQNFRTYSNTRPDTINPWTME